MLLLPWQHWDACNLKSSNSTGGVRRMFRIQSLFVYLPAAQILLTSQIKWRWGKRGLRMINVARVWV